MNLGSIVALVAVVLSAFLNLWMVRTWEARTAWWISMALIAFALLLLGWIQGKRFWGLLVDEHNRVSLSRFQLFLWTVLLLPAMVTAASTRMAYSIKPPVPMARTTPTPSPTPAPVAPAGTTTTTTTTTAGATTVATGGATAPPATGGTGGTGAPSAAGGTTTTTTTTTTPTDGEKKALPPITLEQALDFTIPAEVWLLLGISVASAAGASLLNARNTEENRIAENTPAEKPSLADLFRGDQAATANVVDIARVQNVFFTVVTVWVYGAALSNLFAGIKLSDQFAAYVTSLPLVNAGMATFLAISHAGYLANKAVPKQGPQSAAKTGNVPAGTPPPAVPVSGVVSLPQHERPLPENVTVHLASRPSEELAATGTAVPTAPVVTNATTGQTEEEKIVLVGRQV